MLNKLPALILLSVTLAACGPTQATAANAGADPSSEALSPFVAAKNGSFLARLDWISGQPQAKQPSTGKIAFFTPAQSPAQVVAEVVGQISMPAHSHHPEAVTFNHVASGPAATWDFAGLRPSMSGDWVLRVTATVDGAAADTVDLSFNVK